MIFKGQQLKRGVIGIDCGLSGAICLMTNNKITVIPMPNTPEEIRMAIWRFREAAKAEFGGLMPISIIEHVEGRGEDSGYTVAKLTFNYGLCYAYCDGLGLQPVTFYPVTWKTYMGLKIVQSSQFTNIKVTTSVKKQKTVDFIKRIYPWFEFNKPLCDAIALCEFGKRLQLGEIALKAKHKDQAIKIKKILEQKA